MGFNDLILEILHTGNFINVQNMDKDQNTAKVPLRMWKSGTRAVIISYACEQQKNFGDG